MAGDPEANRLTATIADKLRPLAVPLVPGLAPLTRWSCVIGTPAGERKGGAPASIQHAAKYCYRATPQKHDVEIENDVRLCAFHALTLRF